MIDSINRSLVKALTWRLSGSLSTLVVSWLVTGDIKIAGTIFGIQFVVNTVLYFVHERIWNLVKWGRST
jgi:uncharacterized membrane protein